MSTKQRNDVSRPTTLKATFHVFSNQEHVSLLENLHSFLQESKFTNIQIKDYDLELQRLKFEAQTFVEEELFDELDTKLYVDFMLSSNSKQDVLTFAEGLVSTFPSVVFVDLQSTLQTWNRYAQGLCDTGVTETTSVISQYFNGSEEIVAVADSGLDLMSCYFHDSKTSFQYQVYRPTTSAVNLRRHLLTRPTSDKEDRELQQVNTVLNPTHRKVVQYIMYADSSDDEDAHGTHVCGSIAGQAATNTATLSDTAYDGMSPGARLSFFDIGPDGLDYLLTPTNINTNLLQQQYLSGARIFSHSWGSSDNIYDSLAAQVDTFMWLFPDALVLFAAGNDGQYGRATVGTPATCKSGLTVGASLNDEKSWKEYTTLTSNTAYLNRDAVAYFSSQGPTRDGRMKPDILAPGYFIASAKGKDTSNSVFCDRKLMAGTSMATPITAGMAVKVRQYFLQGYYPSGNLQKANAFIPSGALLKAMLIHSGQQMSTIVRAGISYMSLQEYPSVVQGYGRVQLNATMKFSNQQAEVDPTNRNGFNPLYDLGLFVMGAVDESSLYHVSFHNRSKHVYTFQSSVTVSEGMRVTLSYTDYPGSAATSLATVSSVMVNVLQLTVKDATGKVFYPYQASSVSTKWSNVQVLDIDKLTPNMTYTVMIACTTLHRGPQPYALVITGPMESRQTRPQVTTLSPEESGNDSERSSFLQNGIYVLLIIIVITSIVACFVGWIVHRVYMKPYASSSTPNANFNTNGASGTARQGGTSGSNRYEALFSDQLQPAEATLYASQSNGGFQGIPVAVPATAASTGTNSSTPVIIVHHSFPSGSGVISDSYGSTVTTGMNEQQAGDDRRVRRYQPSTSARSTSTRAPSSTTEMVAYASTTQSNQI